MPHQPRKALSGAPKPDNPEEYKRFLDAAKEVGASDNPEDFDRAFEKVVTGKLLPIRQKLRIDPSKDAS
jgi:hypothetical protein